MMLFTIPGRRAAVHLEGSTSNGVWISLCHTVIADAGKGEVVYQARDLEGRPRCIRCDRYFRRFILLPWDGFDRRDAERPLPRRRRSRKRQPGELPL